MLHIIPKKKKFEEFPTGSFGIGGRSLAIDTQEPRQAIDGRCKS
jgi:hypothetical protein